MSMERALYTLLKSVPSMGIGEPTTPRIYGLRAPQNVAAPYIVFQRVNTFDWRSINNPSGVAQAEMQIDFYAPSYYAAKDLSEKVNKVLDGFRGELVQHGASPVAYTKFGGISRQNAIETIDETAAPVLYRVTATYTVTYHH